MLSNRACGSNVGHCASGLSTLNADSAKKNAPASGAFAFLAQASISGYRP
jgi:hypothetical protein